MLVKINICIRQITDFSIIWPLFKETVSQSNTFIYNPNITEEEAKKLWETDIIYAAFNKEEVPIGTYRLRNNQLHRGSHIANASFMVSKTYQSQGIGRLLAQHCLDTAKKLGYLAMQFNMVLCHNRKSLSLWLSLGFKVICRIPKAYKIKENTYEDALVLFKEFDT